MWISTSVPPFMFTTEILHLFCNILINANLEQGQILPSETYALKISKISFFQKKMVFM